MAWRRNSEARMLLQCVAPQPWFTLIVLTHWFRLANPVRTNGDAIFNDIFCLCKYIQCDLFQGSPFVWSSKTRFSLERNLHLRLSLCHANKASAIGHGPYTEKHSASLLCFCLRYVKIAMLSRQAVQIGVARN